MASTEKTRVKTKEKEKTKVRGDRIEKKHKKEKTGESKQKDKAEKKAKLASHAFSLLADEERVDPTLSSLFAAKPTPPVRPTRSRQTAREDVLPTEDDEHENDEDISDPEIDQDVSPIRIRESNGAKEAVNGALSTDSDHPPQRKRRRKQEGEEIEDIYMRRLAREEAKEAQSATAEREAKRLKIAQSSEEAGEDNEEDEAEPAVDDEQDLDKNVLEDAEMSPPPLHETIQPSTADAEIDKANRTVFLGNVSTTAITSKPALKLLTSHLKSVFPKPTKGEAQQQHKLESLRFRSTPYATSSTGKGKPLPKKASFARKELMPTTTPSTHAYAVYSSASLAREAVRALNGTVVLDRHLRVDSVAHPTKVEHRRCVFVGNLGFVDDETSILAANANETRKAAKQPSDIEEGLWRVFGKCGTVESVRVIRDSATRVGKGIAYVQFEDGNAVEAALGLEGKKFPPMLPRKLRVSRAKAVKKSGAGKSPVDRSQRRGSGAVVDGRVKKLFGRAAAAQSTKQRQPLRGREGRRSSGSMQQDRAQIPNGFAKPEAFVFEGHRASSKGGKSGLKLGGKKKGGKPTNRGAKRGAAFKAAKRKG